MTDEESKQNIKRYIDNELNIDHYIIDDDLTIEAENVWITSTTMVNIPIRFSAVSNLEIRRNKNLVNLKGCPKLVRSKFSCTENGLTSLEGCPEVIGDLDFNCSFNKLTSLEHCPQKLNRLVCGGNKLTDLKGCSPTVTNLYCDNNNLTSLEGLPNRLTNLNINNNPYLYEIDHFNIEFDSKNNYVYCNGTPVRLIYNEKIFDSYNTNSYTFETIVLMQHSKMFIKGTNKIKLKNLKYFYMLMKTELTGDIISRIETLYEIV